MTAAEQVDHQDLLAGSLRGIAPANDVTLLRELIFESRATRAAVESLRADLVAAGVIPLASAKTRRTGRRPPAKLRDEVPVSDQLRARARLALQLVEN